MSGATSSRNGKQCGARPCNINVSMVNSLNVVPFYMAARYEARPAGGRGETLNPKP